MDFFQKIDDQNRAQLKKKMRLNLWAEATWVTASTQQTWLLTSQSLITWFFFEIIFLFN
jgi:hypothetical protein